MGYHREIDLCRESLDLKGGCDEQPATHEEQTYPRAIASDSHVGDLLLDRDSFQIRIANREEMTESDLLIDRMYSWRGYKRGTHGARASEADEITLQVCQGATVFGTLTIRFDSECGLAADLLYQHEIDAYRQANAKVAELTRLAISPKLGSKEVLGALFHLAYVCVGPIRNIANVFIEVHPRHVGFYRRMLNFRRAGECKFSPRVEAPAVLLHVEVAYVGEQAALCGGQQPVESRSLYPYFCSAREEAGAIQNMLLRGDASTRPTDTDTDIVTSGRPVSYAPVGSLTAA